jgi:hypothetical protein
MAQKQVYKTARGVEIDMLRMAKQNELVPAVGNANVNARGDKLGPGGQIVKTREQIVSERSGASIPNQVNVRPAVQETPAPKTTKKDISNQDPEGNDE